MDCLPLMSTTVPSPSPRRSVEESKSVDRSVVTFDFQYRSVGYKHISKFELASGPISTKSRCLMSNIGSAKVVSCMKGSLTPQSVSMAFILEEK